MRTSTSRGSFTTALAAGLLVALAPATAQAATTIGQSPPISGTPSPAGQCDTLGALADIVQLNTGTGNPYVVPSGGGVITGWRTSFTGDPAQARLRLFAATSNTLVMTPIAESATETVAAPPAPFPTRLPAAGGEFLGLSLISGAGTGGCLNGTTASAVDIVAVAAPAGSVGASETVTASGGPVLANISANLEPDADKDGFGDETQDALFIKTPKKKTKSTKARFVFTGAASFECRLDKKKFAPCVSPKRFKKLKVRRHTFRVHAVTSKGEFSPDSTFKWRVND